MTSPKQKHDGAQERSAPEASDNPPHHDSPSPRQTRRAVTAAASAPAADPIVRKPVNTLAIVPKTQKITPLGRKAYNVLLYIAQGEGLESEVFRAPLDQIMKGVDFDSHDQELIKKHLRAMVSTTVEWQSPTTGEGTQWNVSGLLAHAALSKIRGQTWVEWSYAVNLKQELLSPNVFARLSIEIISQLRSHPAIALYEICSRYKAIGQTSRQPWQWWRPVLSGKPDTDKTAKLEYRIFKRDTLKPAIAEVCSVTDLDVELVEFKQGRFISDLQFSIKSKAQKPLPLQQRPDPVDLALIKRAQGLGIDEDKADEWAGQIGPQRFAAALDTLERRIQSEYPEPLRDRARYLKTLVQAESSGKPQLAQAKSEQGQGGDSKDSGETAELPSARQERWVAEWLKRRRAEVVAQIEALSPEQQNQLVSSLAQDMERRGVHPTIRKRLDNGSWRHPMVVHEMARYYALAAIGEGWDKPTDAQLLAIAAQEGR
jgi:hypothetical protein